MPITYKTESDVAGMRVAGRLASEVLDYLTPHVQAGITTDALDKLAHDYIVDVQQAIPAPLNYAPGGYKPYPKSICTSVNHTICHGIPNDKALKKGDIINIDITVIKDGWHGDTSRMFVVGDGSIAAKRLCSITYEAMWKGIVMVKPGVRLGDIGYAIQTFAQGHGFSVVREFCGHGIGRGCFYLGSFRRRRSRPARHILAFGQVAASFQANRSCSRRWRGLVRRQAAARKRLGFNHWRLSASKPICAEPS